MLHRLNREKPKTIRCPLCDLPFPETAMMIEKTLRYDGRDRTNENGFLLCDVRCPHCDGIIGEFCADSSQEKSFDPSNN